MIRGNKMEHKFSLAEYVADKERIAFVCSCKECVAKMSSYLSVDEWLDIAYVLVDSDFITKKEFKKLNHLAVTQWALISEKIGA